MKLSNNDPDTHMLYINKSGGLLKFTYIKNYIFHVLKHHLQHFKN